jgi:hypothetical protein
MRRAERPSLGRCCGIPGSKRPQAGEPTAAARSDGQRAGFWFKTGQQQRPLLTHSAEQPRCLSVGSPRPEVQSAKLKFKEITADGHRTVAVIESIRTNFGADAGRKTLIDVNDLIGETRYLIRDDLHRHRVIVEAGPDARRPKIFGDRIIPSPRQWPD